MCESTAALAYQLTSHLTRVNRCASAAAMCSASALREYGSSIVVPQSSFLIMTTDFFVQFNWQQRILHVCSRQVFCTRARLFVISAAHIRAQRQLVAQSQHTGAVALYQGHALRESLSRCTCGRAAVAHDRLETSLCVKRHGPSSAARDLAVGNESPH
jgi:hypothetical protein